MVDDESRVERLILVHLMEANAEQVLVDRRVDGSVEQRSCQLDVHLLGDDRMWIAREYPIVGQTNHHRDSPWVRAEQPVERGLLIFAELVVARHATIEVSLGRKGCHEVVGAPDERYTDPESIVRSSRDRCEPLSVVPGQDFFIGGTDCTAPDLIVTVVVPRIPLIVFRCICSHPGSYGLA